ncbi:MAG: hypothetical protein ACKO3W_15860 [bacterium]
MRVTPQQRMEMIARVRAKLVTGVSLADACASEIKGADSLKPATFMLWVRRYARSAKPSMHASSAHLKGPCLAVLGDDSEFVTLGGVGTSFNAQIRTRLFAEFDPARGVNLWYRSTSALAQISYDGRSQTEEIAEGLRSLREIRRAVEDFGDPQYGRGVDADDAIRRAHAAFPWLPTRIREAGVVGASGGDDGDDELDDGLEDDFVDPSVR